MAHHARVFGAETTHQFIIRYSDFEFKEARSFCLDRNRKKYCQINRKESSHQ